MCSHMFIYDFVDYSLGVIPKNHYEDPCQGFFPLFFFSSRSFIISSVTLKLLIHFKSIFVTGLRGLLSFFYT